MIDWLLENKPRPVQLEALNRGYRGLVTKSTKDSPTRFEKLPHHGHPAKGFAYFMEMRTGKTNVAINEFLLMQREGLVSQMLVLAPNKFKEGWYNEIKTFASCLREHTHVFESTHRKEAWGNLKAPELSVLIVNYEALVSEDTQKLIDQFVSRAPTLAVADESVLIKNRTTRTFKIAFALTAPCPYWRILTGKPVVQGPHDLWSQFRFIRKLDGWNYYAFRNTFCIMGGFQSKQVKGSQNEKKLQQLMAPHVFIAHRRDWGTDFKPDYEARAVDMLPEQKRHYKEMHDDFITWVREDRNVTADQVITKHLKLQQISSGFIIDEQRQGHRLCPPDKIPKIVELKDMLENQVLHKALVICFFRYSLEVLMRELNDFNPCMIAGNEQMKARDLNVETEKAKFNWNPKHKVLVAQVQAVKYGHNLMGPKESPCTTILYYENNYSLDDRSQSEQRPQGEGQTCATHIVDFYSSAVEREVVRALQRKEDVAAKILNFARGY